MTTAYEIAVRLGLAGTDAEIAAQLQATGLTPKKIPLSQLLFVLNRRHMLVRLIRPADTGEKWAGSVVNMILAVNANGTADQIAAVNEWFSHITNDRNEYYDTTDVTMSGPLWQMRSMFGGLETMPTVADFDAIAAIGGGWLFADLTAERYAAQKAAAEAKAIIQPVWAAAKAVIDEGIFDGTITTVEQITAVFGGE